MIRRWAFVSKLDLNYRCPRLWEIWLAPPDLLRPHEEINPQHLMSLYDEILRDGVLKTPLLVDYSTFVILDGHHRFEILKRMGAKRIPVFLINYKSCKISVGSWRNNVKVTKSLVLKAGLSGKRLPFKTSRHVLLGGKVPEVRIPLSLLKL